MSARCRHNVLVGPIGLRLFALTQRSDASDAVFRRTRESSVICLQSLGFHDRFVITVVAQFTHVNLIHRCRCTSSRQ